MPAVPQPLKVPRRGFRNLLTALLVTCHSSLVTAQVTIGSENNPVSGAILDLNSTVKGGLVLSNVVITDLYGTPDEIPESLGG
jgi:hypothetical protein